MRGRPSDGVAVGRGVAGSISTSAEGDTLGRGVGVTDGDGVGDGVGVFELTLRLRFVGVGIVIVGLVLKLKFESKPVFVFAFRLALTFALFAAEPPRVFCKSQNNPAPAPKTTTVKRIVSTTISPVCCFGCW